MYQLNTQLTHFRFNSIHNQGPFTVTWFKLSEEDNDTEGVCFTQQELKDLTDYVANNKMNFNNQNYFSCNSDDTACCDIYDLLPLKSHLPRNLIIRKIPQIQKSGSEIYSCMDIELLNINGVPNNNYNLKFDIIGRIEG